MTLRATAIAAALTLAPATAQSFQTELTPDRDNTIYDAPALSNGAGTRCFAGLDNNGGRKRALLRFDVAGSGAIPAGSTITAAELELTLQQTQSGGSLAVHALTADWGEGASFASSGQGGGAPSQPGDANWFDRVVGAMPPSTWTNPGGDFLAAQTATTVVSAPPTPQTVVVASTFVTAADVQAWLDSPATNFGWILIGDETRSGTAMAFATREDADNAPRLRVTYTPPPNAAVTGEYGAGCDPFFDKPRLAAVGRPVVGSTFTIQSTPGGSGAPITALAVSLAAAASPVPVSAFVSAGRDCFFHVDLGQVIFFGMAGSTLSAPLPAGTAVGLDLYWQGFGIEPTNQVVVVTNGLQTRTGSF